MSILAAIDNFTLDQGAKFSRLYFYEDDGGAPVDLTGYTAKMQIKPYNGGSTIQELTHSAGITLGTSGGDLTVDLTAVETAAFTFVRARFDLELYPAGVAADAIRLVQGEIVLSQEVTV